jgi:hypothetical protein
VSDPVVGIMIRTRIGLNVYGTNTELEKLKLGPCMAGNTLELAFAFWCELCPGEYTLTVASHDPDGVWHDWLEDAVAFTVSDSGIRRGANAAVSLLGGNGQVRPLRSRPDQGRPRGSIHEATRYVLTVWNSHPYGSWAGVYSLHRCW